MLQHANLLAAGHVVRQGERTGLRAIQVLPIGRHRRQLLLQQSFGTTRSISNSLGCHGDRYNCILRGGDKTQTCQAQRDAGDRSCTRRHGQRRGLTICLAIVLSILL